MKRLFNHMKMQALLAWGEAVEPRIGIVKSYDPDNYCCKVAIQPEGTETGWIPIAAAWVGNEWGLFAPPSYGDQVAVHFQEGDYESGYVELRFFSNEARPVQAEQGEFYIIHKSGSYLKFLNGGSVDLKTAEDLNVTVEGDMNITTTGKVTASASEFDLTGDLKVTGNIYASGDISDDESGTKTMESMRNVHNTHTHNETGSVTAVPNQLE